MKSENTTLFYKQERSDKIYKASLEEKEGNFIVNFAYGRRGSTLKTGTKTQTPVPFEKAKKIYDKLVLSKESKGYVPDEDNTSADDEIRMLFVCPSKNRIIAPYDGGVDVIMDNKTAKDEMKIMYKHWLSDRNDGL